jgi:hypothetical protein
VSHVFVMEWAAVTRDIAIGLLIAGAVAAWVPDSFWSQLFFTGHPLASKLWGPLIGPVVSLLSFVCSIGNVPLAAVLWNGGISFGGVVAFIFADLIIVPILVDLPEVLRHQDDAVHPGHLLRHHGRRRIPHRADLRHPRPDPVARRTPRQSPTAGPAASGSAPHQGPSGKTHRGAQ